MAKYKIDYYYPGEFWTYAVYKRCYALGVFPYWGLVHKSDYLSECKKYIENRRKDGLPIYMDV